MKATTNKLAQAEPLGYDDYLLSYDPDGYNRLSDKAMLPPSFSHSGYDQGYDNNAYSRCGSSSHSGYE
jgi:hypothetical protein